MSVIFAVKSETKSQQSVTQLKINELQAQLDAKNSYYDLYKTDLAKTKKMEEERVKNASTLSYDKVF